MVDMPLNNSKQINEKINQLGVKKSSYQLNANIFAALKKQVYYT